MSQSATTPLATDDDKNAIYKRITQIGRAHV